MNVFPVSFWIFNILTMQSDFNNSFIEIWVKRHAYLEKIKKFIQILAN